MTTYRSLVPLLVLLAGQLAGCAEPLPTPPRPPAPVTPVALPEDGSQGSFGATAPARRASPASSPAPR